MPKPLPEPVPIPIPTSKQGASQWCHGVLRYGMATKITQIRPWEDFVEGRFSDCLSHYAERGKSLSVPKTVSNTINLNIL